MPVLAVRGEWAGWTAGTPRERFERDVLPGFLRPRRWFAGKARTLESARIIDLATLDRGEGGQTLTLALIEARYAIGQAEVYFLPIAATAEAEAGPFDDPRWSIAALEGSNGRALLHDALADPDACAELLRMIGSGRSIATKSGGEIRGVPTEAFAGARGPEEVPSPVRASSAEQSNSAVFFGDRLILKAFRRPEPGVNPDFEIGRFLTERAHFDRVPRTAGAIEYHRPGSEPTTLAILQGLVANEGSGWEHTLAGLADYYERLGGRSTPPPVHPAGRSTLELSASSPPAEVAGAIGPALADAATLGRRTAEMHLALASDAEDPAFAPIPQGREDFARIAREVREQVESALATLAEHAPKLSIPADEQARKVLNGRSNLLARLETLAGRGPGGCAIRVHGDYHLGQVLRVGEDYVLLDFEGEPARPLARRKQKETPIKDVVGMIRSFDYAAHAGLFAATEGRAEGFDRLAPWARAWSDWTSAAFLRAYLERAGDAEFLPADRGLLASLIEAFLLDKSLYELLYELNNRPDWVRIPLGGVLALAERGRGDAAGST